MMITSPIRVSFSESPFLRSRTPGLEAALDVAPFLTELALSNIAYAGQWFAALLLAEDDTSVFLGEVDFYDLVDWARASGEVDFYGFAQQVVGLNAALPSAAECYNALPLPLSTEAKAALKELALLILSGETLTEVNALFDRNSRAQRGRFEWDVDAAGRSPLGIVSEALAPTRLADQRLFEVSGDAAPEDGQTYSDRHRGG